MKEKNTYRRLFKTHNCQQSKATDKGPHRKDVMSQMGLGFMIANEHLQSTFDKTIPQKKFQ